MGQKANNKSTAILVLGGDNRSFLSVIRSLGRQGYRVHTAMCPPGVAALQSRYIHTHHGFVLPQQGDQFEIAPFLEMLRREVINLVLPCDEPTSRVMALHRAEIESITKVSLLDEATAAVALDKARMNQLARSLEIPLPREAFIAKGTVDLDIFYRDWSAPVVLKPVSSFSDARLGRRFSVHKAYSNRELTELLPAMAQNSDLLIQENFVGTGVGVECLAQEGELLFVFQHRRVHEPIHGGGSSYRKSVAVNPALRDAVKKLVRALNYTGVAMFEFKVNERTGRWVFIELNPRFWGSLPLALAAGADFPAYLVEMLLHGRVASLPETYRVGLYCRNMTQDLQWVKENLGADRTDPLLATLPLGSWALEILHVVRFQEKNDTWALDDPLPFFVEMGQILANMGGKIRRRLLAIMMNNRFSRKKKVRRAKALTAQAPSILFVCGGNICRSVFAQYELQNRPAFKGQALSAGCYALDGRQPPVEAVEAARHFKLEIDGHLAQHVDSVMVERADVVFYFDVTDAAYLEEHYPAAYRCKMFPLGCLIGADAIEDPYSRGIETFLSVYSQIHQSIDEFEFD